MNTFDLQPSIWERFLADRASQVSNSKVDVQTLDPERERLTRAESARIQSIAYDDETRVFSVVCEGLDLRIEEPQSMRAVEEADGTLRGLEVVDGKGLRHIVAIKPPLALGG